MILFTFLIIVIVFLVLYFLIFQKLPLKIISKALNAKIRVQSQSGLFSFAALYLDTPYLLLSIAESKVYIHITGFFTRKSKLLSINIARLRVKQKNIKYQKEIPEKNEINQNKNRNTPIETNQPQLNNSPSHFNNFKTVPDNFKHFNHEKNLSDAQKAETKKELTADKKVFNHILIMFLFYLFRFFEVNIGKIELIKEIDQKSEENTNENNNNKNDDFDKFIEDFNNNQFNFDSSNKKIAIIETSLMIRYERIDISTLSLEFGDSFLEIDGKKIISVNQFGISIIIELIALFDFLSQTKKIILSKSTFSELVIEINESTIELKPLSISVNFFPGNCDLSLTSLKLNIPYEFPQFILSLKNISISTQIPLKNYRQYLNLNSNESSQIQEQPQENESQNDKKKKKKKKSKEQQKNSNDSNSQNIKQIEATIEDFNVKIVSDHFLNLTKIYFSICDFKKLDFYVTVSTFFFHYSTLDGLKIFPVYKMLRNPVFKPPRIVFAFPLNGHAYIDDFNLKLHLTDESRVHLISSNVVYSDGAFQFPLVKLRLNKIQMGTVKKFSISSPDKTFFTFSAENVVAHDRKKFPIGHFIMNIVYAWRIIKPWASKNKYDVETLPFPIAIHLKKVCAKFHDNPINMKLATLATNVIQPFLQEKIVMQSIFNRKVSDLNFSSDQSTNASQKLSELYFNTYQKMIKKQSFHKYILKMTVTDVDCYLDSRNVAPGMENLLHKFDPTTAELHPNVKWETLEGLKIDAKIGSYVAEMMNLKNPFMEGKKATLKGTIIVAEIQDNRSIDVFTNIYNQPYNAAGRATDVKLYCDLSANVDFFEFSFAGPANKLLDDFADTIVSCIPQAKLDPSPPLRWWDMLRNVIRGRYVANVNHFVMNIVGGTNCFDIENALCLHAYDARLQITEGNFMLNTDHIDIFRMKNGPMICHFPKFSTDFSIFWKTKGDGNPKKHLIIPNVDLFGTEGYDTYQNFRATEYTFSFVINFINDKVSPFITLDVAHLSWILDPLLNLFCMFPLNEVYERKCNVDCSRKDNKPEFYSFGSLPCNIIIKMNTTQTFSLRIFDHFPVFEDEENKKDDKNNKNKNKNVDETNKRAINGTSIDISPQNFTLDCNLKVENKECKLNCSIFADSVLFNATDLCIYSKFSKELSTTFMVFTGVVFKYIQEKMSVGVSNIRIIANQFNAKYLKEYFEAFFHFFPDISMDNDTQQTTNSSSSSSDQMEAKGRKDVTRIRKNKRSTINPDGDLLTHLLRRRSSQKTITAQKGRENCMMNNSNNSFFDKYSKPLMSLEVPKVEILVESLQYDALLYACLNKVILNINKNEVRDLLLLQLVVDSLSFRKNETFTNKVEIEEFDIISTSTLKFNFPTNNDENTNTNDNNNNNNNNDDDDAGSSVLSSDKNIDVDIDVIKVERKRSHTASPNTIPLGSLSPSSERKRKKKSKSLSKPKKEEEEDLILIENIRFQYYQNMPILLKENHYETSVKSLRLNACSNDIALIKQFAQEIIPTSTGNKSHEKDKEKELSKLINDNKNDNETSTNKTDNNNNNNTSTSTTTNNNSSNASTTVDSPRSSNINNSIDTNSKPSYIDVSILEFDAIIYDSNIVPIGSLVTTDLAFRSDKRTDNISESSILVKELGINDIRPGAVNPVVLQRWTAMLDGKTRNPLIRFQCKIPPPVGGITIINHLEMNIDPTIVYYESTFFDVLIQFVLSKAVKAAPFFQVSYEFPKANLCLPNVLLPCDVLPSMEEDTSKFMEENKSTEIKLMEDKGEEYFLLRYFKITQTKLNVSYHNPESKIPDINEFNGLFHEIKYQDFNCTINTLIEKLISDISSDMIPQFLKHVIGLGKFQENDENDDVESAANDQMKQSSKQKMMLFGKKKPK